MFRPKWLGLLLLTLVCTILLRWPVLAQTPTNEGILGGSNGAMTSHGPNDPHMQMTPTWPLASEYEAYGAELMTTVRDAISPYTDIAKAEADNYRPFPADPGDMRIVHYVNYRRSWQEGQRLDPTRPGSLLYERQPNGELALLGVMFTAPPDSTLETLNERVPLSLTRWHQHTNICLPRPVWDREQWARSQDGRPLFGPESEIATAADCDAVGGDFFPTLLGWMVHINVFAADPADVWNPMYGHDR